MVAAFRSLVRGYLRQRFVYLFSSLLSPPALVSSYCGRWVAGLRDGWDWQGGAEAGRAHNLRRVSASANRKGGNRRCEAPEQKLVNQHSPALTSTHQHSPALTSTRQHSNAGQIGRINSWLLCRAAPTGPLWATEAVARREQTSSRVTLIQQLRCALDDSETGMRAASTQASRAAGGRQTGSAGRR